MKLVEVVSVGTERAGGGGWRRVDILLLALLVALVAALILVAFVL
jgi:hypothetical protein